jgi:hypothetical protein
VGTSNSRALMCLHGLLVSSWLTGNHYQHFFLQYLPNLLEDVPMAFRTGMWYLHDGAPAHFNRAAQHVLSNTAWPPLSPDLNPLDSYLWGHLNTPMYAAPADSEEALRHCTVDACQIERMRRSMMRRVQVCIEPYGGHSEHLI